MRVINIHMYAGHYDSHYAICQLVAVYETLESTHSLQLVSTNVDIISNNIPYAHTLNRQKPIIWALLLPQKEKKKPTMWTEEHTCNDENNTTHRRTNWQTHLRAQKDSTNSD